MPGSKAARWSRPWRPIELIDPALSSEALLYRLFHERGVKVFNDAPLRAQCSCSRDNVAAMLRSFSQDDRDHMVQDGRIQVTCEFCNSSYDFKPEDVQTTAPYGIARQRRAACGGSCCLPDAEQR